MPSDKQPTADGQLSDLEVATNIVISLSIDLNETNILNLHDVVDDKYAHEYEE